MANIKYTDIVCNLDIQLNDIVFISSDITALSWRCVENGETFDTNEFLNSIIEKIGENGTLIIPTYNWGFCKGETFDYHKTKCKTGALGKVALKREDFKRTQHPIYSFAIWGKDKELLCSMRNKSSFGGDSPFNYLYENNAKNLIINLDYENSFTYVHFAEEYVGNVPYRYLKDFTAEYIDENNIHSIKTYSMLVRDLDMDVKMDINPIGYILESKGISKKTNINGIDFILIDMHRALPVIIDDIVNNRSRNICTYIGQEDNDGK